MAHTAGRSYIRIVCPLVHVGAVCDRPQAITQFADLNHKKWPELYETVDPT